MHANALIPILSEIFDFSFDTAQRIDRVLAEAGLRTKGKGRNLPDVSRREALTFLIACMVTEKITKANEEVSRWLTARGEVNQAPSPEVDPVWGILDSDPEDHQLHLAMEALLIPHKDDGGEVNLINYLLAVCHLIQEKPLSPELVQLEIDFSDLSASVFIFNEEGDIHLTDQFFVIDPTTERPFERVPRSTGIKRKCTVKGTALFEIIIRT